MNNVVIVFILMCLFNNCNAQSMRKSKKPISLTKKEVNELIKSGQAIYDSLQSDKDNLEAYKLRNGQILYKLDSGKGTLWESEEQIINSINESNGQMEVFNMVGWINGNTDIESLVKEANQTLSNYLNKPIDYSESTLKAVSKIKVQNIAKEKELFYSIILYACGFYQNKYGGTLGKMQRQESPDFEPIVTDEKGRTYTPYWEYMKNMEETPKVSLSESIELEHIKYTFRKD